MKKLAKYYFKRLPEVVLVAFGFTLSASVAGDIEINPLYNFWMYGLVILLTLAIAIVDYVCNWYIDKHL